MAMSVAANGQSGPRGLVVAGPRPGLVWWRGSGGGGMGLACRPGAV